MPETGLAPVYRYYTVDLLTDTLLAEIPFSGVSYGRAVKAAGGFTGKIPVIDANRFLNLYESTSPGNTALYVVRNNECVWGGIIWSRRYSVTDKMMEVTGSEFTSYFHHRRIWKTWGHQFGATIVVANGQARVLFDNGSSTALNPGASVRLDFDAVENIRYNGYYRIAGTPTPTTDTFNIDGARSTVSITATERSRGEATVYTEGRHEFHVGDLITVELGPDSPFTGTHAVTAVGGAESDRFSFNQLGGSVEKTATPGIATRPLPDGNYPRTTVSVRADTYDYVRSMVGATFDDFVGIDFPNVYIEPGVSYGVDIVERELDGNRATITTAEPHNLAVGQAVQVQDLDNTFDGEVRVLETRANNKFTYERGGFLEAESVFIKELEIDKLSASGGNAVVTTVGPHRFLPGQHVTMMTGLTFEGLVGTLNGTFEITATPTANTFKFSVPTSMDVPETAFAASTVTAKVDTNLITNPSFEVNVSGWTGVNMTTQRVAASYPYTVGNYRMNGSVSVVGAFPRVESDKMPVKPGDSVTASFIKATSLEHNQYMRIALQFYDASNALLKNVAGDGVFFGGERAYASTIAPANASTFSVWIGTSDNAALGTPIYLDNVVARVNAPDNDYFDGGSAANGDYTYAWTGTPHLSRAIRKNTASVMRRELINGVVTLTTDEPHRFTIGDTMVVSGVVPTIEISEKSLDAAVGEATITTAKPHELVAGDRITIDGIRDSSVISKRAISGSSVTLTTSMSHNFSIGDTVKVSDMLDEYSINNKQLTSNVATLSTRTPHNIRVGDTITISGVYDTYGIVDKRLRENVATLTLNASHNFKVNDDIVVSNLTDVESVVSKSVENGIGILTTSQSHNFLEEEEIVVAGVGAPFDGKHTVLSFTDTRVLFEVEGVESMPPTRSSGSITGSNSVFNGEHIVSAVTSTTVSYQRGGNDSNPAPGPGGALDAWSPLNGSYACTAVPSATSFSYAKAGNNMPSAPVLIPDSDELLPPIAAVPSILLGDHTISAITRNTLSFNQSGIPRSVGLTDVSGTVTAPSIFNGTRVIKSVTRDTIKFNLSGRSNVLETTVNSLSFIRVPDIFNGTFTITDVDSTLNTVSYARAHSDLVSASVIGKGIARVRPIAVVSSFGPFPGNANIGVNFSTRKYSGTNVTPISYRGFELTNVGEALDAYSDSIDGFEYRIDCAFDPETRSFTKTFVILPINFPNPPAEGELSPISRFGAEKFVFEYPGNIIDISIEESAENAATRFFAIGENDLGPDAGPPFSVAAAEDLLRGANGRRWPLLDDDEKISDIDDETVLYAYAQRYLSESRPPDASLSVSVNSSIQPLVGSYAPGDWCSLVVDDDFFLQRLKSGLEPRDTVMIRKIDAMKVSVPDSVAFPEKVELTLVPEWEVDKRG